MKRKKVQAIIWGVISIVTLLSFAVFSYMEGYLGKALSLTRGGFVILIFLLLFCAILRQLIRNVEIYYEDVETTSGVGHRHDKGNSSLEDVSVRGGNLVSDSKYDADGAPSHLCAIYPIVKYGLVLLLLVGGMGACMAWLAY